MDFLKKTACIFMILMLLAAVSMGASAAPVADEKGSITVRIAYQGESVVGGSLTLYRVGDFSSETGFALNREFAGSGVELSDPYTGTMARQLADYARAQAIPGETRTVGDNGTVVFQTLKAGLYLVVQNEAAEDFQPINPFLIGIPMALDGEYAYHVDATPKAEPLPEPTEPTVPELPQTGQTNWPVPVMAVLGIGFLAAGCVLCFGGKKARHET